MNYQDISLGEFVQQLAIRFSQANLTMPFQDERPWHELLYGLKKGLDPKPTFLQNLIFDWNGPYPRAVDLSEYLYALHWTGCFSAANPSYDEFSLNDDVKAIWQRDAVEPGLRDYLDRASEAARELFQPA